MIFNIKGRNKWKKIKQACKACPELYLDGANSKSDKKWNKSAANHKKRKVSQISILVRLLDIFEIQIFWKTGGVICTVAIVFRIMIPNMLLFSLGPKLNTKLALNHHPPPPPTTHHPPTLNSTSAISQLLLTRFWPNFKHGFLGPSLTHPNYHGDICPGNICPVDICPYRKYLSCYWPDLTKL